MASPATEAETKQTKSRVFGEWIGIVQNKNYLEDILSMWIFFFPQAHYTNINLHCRLITTEHCDTHPVWPGVMMLAASFLWHSCRIIQKNHTGWYGQCQNVKPPEVLIDVLCVSPHRLRSKRWSVALCGAELGARPPEHHSGQRRGSHRSHKCPTSSDDRHAALLRWSVDACFVPFASSFESLVLLNAKNCIISLYLLTWWKFMKLFGS